MGAEFSQGAFVLRRCVALRQEDVFPEVIAPTDKKRGAELIKFHLVVSFVLCSC